MIELLVLVLGIALLDSLNPSALVITLLLLTQKRSKVKVITYITAIFTAYLSIGIVVMLGLDIVADLVDDLLYSPIAYAIQGMLGAFMLIYSFIAPNKAASRTTHLPESPSPMGIFLLGITVTIVEFSTALPYIGALGLLTNANLSIIQWLLILMVYNVIFVTPPLVLLFLYCVLGDHLEQRFARYREKVDNEARETFLWIIGLIGFFLLMDSLSYFEFFGLLGA